MSWASRTLSLSLRRELTYRAAFWVQFFLSSATELSVAWFVWRAVFESAGTEKIGGFTFHEMLYYVLLAGQANRAAYGSGSWGIAEEIYSGSLNRYLIYPIPLFRYKYVEHLSGQLMRLLQSAACISIAALIFGPPPPGALSATAIISGIAAVFIAGLLIFQLLLMIEMLAFWQDVVWNILTMLRFLIQLLGGTLIPIALFPEWARAAVNLTPFPLLVSFPARCLLGQVSGEEWIASAVTALFWSLALGFLSQLIWKRGLLRYAGTGI